MSDQTPRFTDAAEMADPHADSGMSGAWTAFLAAVQLLTRVRVQVRVPLPVGARTRSPPYFPLVGGLIGAFTASVMGVGCSVWPVWLAAIAAIAVEAFLTGAFHEDAVADFCDAFGGGWTREDLLRILKDSRIGTYGALGLGLAVSLRAACLVAIVQQHGLEHWPAWSSAIVASSVVGRWAIVLVMVWLPPIPHRDGLSRDVGSRLTGRHLLAATFWMAPAAAWMALELPWQAALSAALLAPAIVWFVSLVNRRLGGTTGDCLGCIGYIGQVIVLLAAAARWPT